MNDDIIFIDGDMFENMCDLGFGDKYTKLKKLDLTILNDFIVSFKENRLPLIYVDSDRVKDFFEIVKNYDKSFALLSHNGDTNFYDQDIQNRPKCIKKWFGQNIDAENNDNILSLPIGLERKFWSNHKHKKFGLQHNVIKELRTKIISKNDKIFICHNDSTNTIKRGWIKPFFMKNEDYYIQQNNVSFKDFYINIMSYEYMISPEGNGIDCHRTWEILYLNSIPILEDSIYNRNIYSNLPVMMIKSFKDIDKNFLYINNTMKNEYNEYQKINFKYWEKEIFNMLKKN